MKLIDAITDYPFQKMTVIGDNKERIDLTFRYMASQQLWRLDVSYGDFSAYGLLCMQSINLLRQWQDILPFGLMVRSVDGQDPFYLNDFSSGRIVLFYLNQSDLNALEAAYT